VNPPFDTATVKTPKTLSDCPWALSLKINWTQSPIYINSPRKRISLKHYAKHSRMTHSIDFMPGGRKTTLSGTPVFLMVPVDGTRLPTSIGGYKDFHYLTSMTKGSAPPEFISSRKLQENQ